MDTSKLPETVNLIKTAQELASFKVDIENRWLETEQTVSQVQLFYLAKTFVLRAETFDERPK